MAVDGLPGSARRTSPAIFRVAVRSRVIALSFDDGPDPRWTPTVLRVLARHRAHATFFVIGARAFAFPVYVRRELAAGDEIGDHTWSHPDLSELPRARVEKEIASGAAAIEWAGAPRPTLFRPPFGFFDDTVATVARADGLRMILWNLAVEHYVDHAGERVALARLLHAIRPGAIVLAHDGGTVDRSRTIAALPLLLDELAARGYRFTTVSALIAAGRPEATRG
jgi:peptidoglycan/xylan/chitin deacetylase (PgdA/CDA1 family)